MNTELLDVIRAVHRGQKRIPPEIAAELADRLPEPARERRVTADCGRQRQTETSPPGFSITEETVKNHITHILAKLGANDRTHVVTVGIKRGYIGL